MKIEIKNYTKYIKKRIILDDINMTLTSGKVYGFRGQNGSGKTMLMRAITGLIYPTKGAVYIDGEKLGKDISVPKSLGILIENPAFLDEYTGYDNLKMLADISVKQSKENIQKVLNRVGLEPNDKRLYRQYSLGMRQKLGIAAAIMGEPDLIVLDEPINAIDENGQAVVREILKDLRNKDKLVIIACHNREELDFLSDEIYELEDGRVTNSYGGKGYENN